VEKIFSSLCDALQAWRYFTRGVLHGRSSYPPSVPLLPHLRSARMVRLDHVVRARDEVARRTRRAEPLDR